MEDFAPVLVSIAFFATVVLSFYFYLKARHTERMALIEKGLLHVEKKQIKIKTGSLSFKLGSFFISIALGLFFGYLIAQYSIINPVVSYFSMILLFGGISFIFNYFFEAKKSKIEG
jgi:hypothetical protein